MVLLGVLQTGMSIYGAGRAYDEPSNTPAISLKALETLFPVCGEATEWPFSSRIPKSGLAPYPIARRGIRDINHLGEVVGSKPVTRSPVV